MPTYQIKDPQSGKTLSVSGNQPPSQQEADHLFTQAGLRPQSVTPWLNPAMQVGGAVVGAGRVKAAGMGLGAAIPGLDMTGLPEAVGGYLGGIGGAGVGAGVGNAGADLIRSGLGDKTVNLGDTLQNSIDAGKAGMVGQAVGAPLGKALGFIAHPIQPFIDSVDKTLASSAKTVNIGDVGGLLSQFKNQLIPQMTQDGYGPEAMDTYNKLQSRIVGMAQSRLAHVPADSGVTQDINSLTVPISAANGIKRDLYQLAKNTYSGIRQKTDVMSPLEQTGAANFASMLKNNIGAQEPGVNLPNAIASNLYKVPEMASGLSQILSFGNPSAAKAIQMIDKIPGGAVQKIQPAVSAVLPYLTQLLYGASQNQAKQQ